MTTRTNCCLLALFLIAAIAAAQPLPGTQPLTVEGDVASQMIDGIDRFLDKQIETTVAARPKAGDPADMRVRLGRIIGLRDQRPPKVEMERVATTDRDVLVARSEAFEVAPVRWKAFAEVHGEGLLITPKLVAPREPLADVIAIPDADHTPEMIAGLVDEVPPESQYAKRLAEMGFRVIVPVLMDRKPRPRVAPGRKTGPEFGNREYLYRSAYELGRHPIGYEVQKVLAAVDWSAARVKRPVAVFGWGEGGLVALYAAALDTRIKAAGVSGYFGRREGVWREPIERSVFGLLERFGDAELASMVYPRGLVIESADGPRVSVRSKGAVPAELGTPVDPASEHRRWRESVPADERALVQSVLAAEVGKFATDAMLARFATLVTDEPKKAPPPGPQPEFLRHNFDPEDRQARQFDELDRHTQGLIAESANDRRRFMSPLNDAPDLATYERRTEWYRKHLYDEVLGRFREPLLPMNARTRKVYDTDKFTGYELLLDVFPDVIAYGILLLPKDLKEGERRPVVVCQHGLEGRPKDTIEGNSPYYHDFAAKLAERGFVTFAPQNPYIFGERFRQLSRKAAPIGKTLWSWIIPQHQQILAFLQSQPNVDPKRIAIYGLSYGGKTALRVPAVLPDYCLSICSGDFNEWVYKISSNRAPWSYLFTHEYEIYEFDLASAFNHAEMAALIAPRPFMVERGHADGVSSDEYVAFEFAKVRRLYAGRLKLPADRCAIEFFDGPHTINGKGTFEFLHKHLNWEKR